MFKHIVMFKLKENTPGNLNKAVSALRSLEGNIETLRYIEVGIDIKKSETAYNIVVSTHFDDESGYAAYTTHPNHLAVIDIISKLCSGRESIEYIIA